MPRKKKHFLDTSNAVKFSLVHRDQKDPLIAGDGAQRVFMPVVTRQVQTKDQNMLDIEPAEKKAEEHKFGIYYDDDYNYLQHLRSADEVVSWEPIESRFRISADGRVTEAGTDLVTDDDNDNVPPKLNLPSSIFASQGSELKVGLLNQAAPRPGPHPDLDPDIVAALDDDFDYEDADNILDDDFILKANAMDEGEDYHALEEEVLSEAGSSGESRDEFELEETKSRFTEYSMSSSVMRRANGLTHIDDMFEKMYQQYDDEEMGGVDVVEAEDMGGFIEPDCHRLNQLIKEYHSKKNNQRKHLMDAIDEKDEMVGVVDECDQSSAEEEEEDEVIVQETNGDEKWDCESILTTYSTLYNHPTLIDERPKDRKIMLNKKRGLPEGILGDTTGLTAVNLRNLDPQNVVGGRSLRSNASTIKNKDETAEQRKLRKTIVKLERRERREEKKANKTAFKNEDHRISAEKMNKMMTKGMKLV